MIIIELRNSTALGIRLTGLPHNEPTAGEVSFVYLLRQIRQRYQMFDEVWRCSEHYLWLFDGSLYLDPFTAMYCSCAVVSDAKTT